MNGVSVVICCHNSAKRLPETLRHLAAQEVSSSLPWEVIVIDNASTDDTATIAESSWPKSASTTLRVVFEPEAGLSHARIRGIREARHEIISFIDDDNWAAPTWVDQVHSIFQNHLEIGAAGGRIEAVFEIPPPPWFAPLQGFYAVGPQHPQTGDITRTSGTLLCGAGLNLRTSAARRLLDNGFDFIMSGRKGNRLLTGEDTELCFALRATGWLFWYDNELVLQHFIPAARLQWNYVVRLMRGMGDASTYIALYLLALKAPPFERYPKWKKSWLFQLLKILQPFIVVVLSHPIACLSHKEGSLATLTYEKLRGQLASTWKLFNQYQKLQEEIRKSSWLSNEAKIP